MKSNGLWKGILGALLLLVLAAGSIYLAWFISNPTPPEQPLDSNVSTPQTQTQTKTEFLPSTSSDVTDPEESEVTLSASEPESQTETQTETHTETQTETQTPLPTDTGESSKNTETVQEVPLDEILGQITPPPDGTPRKIAFTFDDGPYTPVTQGIADEFAKYGGRCTFFVIGNRIRGDWQTTMKYASDLGHEIAIHGYTHKVYYNKCDEATYQYEVQTTASLIESVTGKAPVLMRPPGGSITNTRVAASPYSIILWNVDTQDWKYSARNQTNVDRIARNILTSVTPGDVVLMHDLYYNSLDAIKLVLPLLAEQGYEFVTVSELLGEQRQAGKKYSKAY